MAGTLNPRLYLVFFVLSHADIHSVSEGQVLRGRSQVLPHRVHLCLPGRGRGREAEVRETLSSFALGTLMFLCLSGRGELDRAAVAYNDRMRKVRKFVAKENCFNLTSHNYVLTQVAADYANKKDDFAVVIQPFFSETDPSNFTVDFLSNVR